MHSNFIGRENPKGLAKMIIVQTFNVATKRVWFYGQSYLGDEAFMVLFPFRLKIDVDGSLAYSVLMLEQTKKLANLRLLARGAL